MNLHESWPSTLSLTSIPKFTPGHSSRVSSSDFSSLLPEGRMPTWPCCLQPPPSAGPLWPLNPRSTKVYKSYFKPTTCHPSSPPVLPQSGDGWCNTPQKEGEHSILYMQTQPTLLPGGLVSCPIPFRTGGADSPPTWTLLPSLQGCKRVVVGQAASLWIPYKGAPVLCQCQSHCVNLLLAVCAQN